MDLALVAIGALAGGAVFFTFVGVVGLYRLPDIYTRAHAVTKADTLGAGFALLAVAIAFGDVATLVKVGVLVAIVFVANPTAIHLLVRSAYRQETPTWTRDHGPRARETGGRPESNGGER